MEAMGHAVETLYRTYEALCWCRWPTGVVATDFAAWKPATVMTTAEAAKARAAAEEAAEAAAEAAQIAADDAAASGASYASMGSVDGAQPAAAAAVAAVVDPSKVSRRCKRRRLSSLVQDGRVKVAAVGAAEQQPLAAQATA